MQFNSYFFILAFLPITLMGYFLLNKKSFIMGELFLLGMSLWFYGYFNVMYLILICLSIVINYALACAIINTRYSLFFTTLGVIGNLATIFYYKYYDFFIGNINSLFHTSFIEKNILLPLGISFFTFQQLSFVIDTYRERKNKYSFLEYALFVCFFPQLVAGPIVLHDELIPLLRDEIRKTFSFENFAGGVVLFSRGLGKKVLIADVCAKGVTWLFDNIQQATSLDIVIISFAYTFQIYFDFSGYSDMATGLARMFNLEMPMNFNSPYKAFSINDFWKRWHMTLTRFFRRYVYIPLGGNKNGKLAMFRNIMIVYLCSGIWHGANWTFILWGILHGMFCVIERCIPKIGKQQSLLGRVYTFIVVDALWLLFRANSVGEWWGLIKKAMAFDDMSLSEGLLSSFSSQGWQFLSAFLPCSRTLEYFPMIAIFIMAGTITWGMHNNVEKDIELNRFSLVTSAMLMFLCLISLDT